MAGGGVGSSPPFFFLLHFRCPIISGLLFSLNLWEALFFSGRLLFSHGPLFYLSVAFFRVASIFSRSDPRVKRGDPEKKRRPWEKRATFYLKLFKKGHFLFKFFQKRCDLRKRGDLETKEATLRQKKATPRQKKGDPDTKKKVTLKFFLGTLKSRFFRKINFWYFWTHVFLYKIPRISFVVLKMAIFSYILLDYG